MTTALHNHLTRDIKPRGECPACDVYHDADVLRPDAVKGVEGDGSDCTQCPTCGYCVDCGDCARLGCGAAGSRVMAMVNASSDSDILAFARRCAEEDDVKVVAVRGDVAHTCERGDDNRCIWCGRAVLPDPRAVEISRRHYAAQHDDDGCDCGPGCPVDCGCLVCDTAEDGCDCPDCDHVCDVEGCIEGERCSARFVPEPSVDGRTVLRPSGSPCRKHGIRRCPKCGS